MIRNKGTWVEIWFQCYHSAVVCLLIKHANVILWILSTLKWSSFTKISVVPYTKLWGVRFFLLPAWQILLRSFLSVFVHLCEVFLELLPFPHNGTERNRLLAFLLWTQHLGNNNSFRPVILCDLLIPCLTASQACLCRRGSVLSYLWCLAGSRLSRCLSDECSAAESDLWQ